jgi:Zierdtviridae exonuclease
MKPTPIRTSERLLFKKCRFAWQLCYGDHLRPHVDAPALRFGTLVHKALEAWYKPGVRRGTHPRITFEKVYAKEIKQLGKFGWKGEDDVWQEAGELGVNMLDHYVETYGKDTEWKVLVTEQRFQVPILNSRDQVVGTYTGILDLVMQNRATNEIFIWDHKTAKAIQTAHLLLDEQAGAYWTYGVEWLYKNGLLKPDQRLAGMYFNFLRKAKKDDRRRNADGHYLNLDGTVSKQQPAPYFHRQPVYRDEFDRQQVRRRVLDEMRDMVAVRTGKTAAYKSPSQMNCGGCGYKDVCELHETGQDWSELMKHTMVTWSPYAWVEVEAAELR